MKNEAAQSRVVIEAVRPVVDGGLFPVKRIPGETVRVEADVFGDGHDHISVGLLYRKTGSGAKWKETPMVHCGNDVYSASFITEKTGLYEFAVHGWIDHGMTWLNGFSKKAAAGENMEVEIQIGLFFIEKMAAVKSTVQGFLYDTINLLKNKAHYRDAVQVLTGERIREVFESGTPRENISSSPVYQVLVERKKALFSAWYEFFPRSASPDPSRAGTFRDCELVLPLVAEMGFDTIYFPPVHPIGKSFRKGKNNSTTALAGEPGSPWAIGSSEGGHKSINPELGTISDFERLVKTAGKLGIEIALDLAFQCAPDHPYVKEHPQWFRWRPDGTVQYAENPPKKYQDVLPINFENDDWKNLWNELKSIVECWIEKGIRIFRVDNPHTKPFVFWQWLLSEIRKKHPEVIFLSEAFTRPKIMARLAKAGFQQSYTYFTWRETRHELDQYMQELCSSIGREFFRPNFWPNTPDILPFYLQNTGYAHSAIRLILASTLSSNYGMYGPVFEQLENTPMPGKEEYFNSEKYEVRHWDWQTRTPFHRLIARLNRIRNENEALQNTFNYVSCQTDQDKLYAYFKAAGENQLLIIVNLDPQYKQSGWVRLPLEALQISEGQVLELEDLLNNRIYHWDKEWNYVELNPEVSQAHIFRIKKYIR
jgi:starch synthase (maltosyl-transferring)